MTESLTESLVAQLTELVSAARCYLACDGSAGAPHAMDASDSLELGHVRQRLRAAIEAANLELLWELLWDQAWTLADEGEGEGDTAEWLDPELASAEVTQHGAR